MRGPPAAPRPRGEGDAIAAIDAEIESVFRRESGRLISVLTRLFGPHNLELAEDVVQASFVAALETWGKAGIPDNPAAWLLTTARHRAIDAIRRERTRRSFAADLTRYLDGEWTLTTTVREAFGEDVIRDDQLRMIFMCCHRGLSSESQLTLILRTLCGLSVPATARALLSSEATIQKRMVRIRGKLRGVEFALPRPEERPAALETTHAALYLLFNEGHLSTGEEPVRRELCRAAMDLTQLIADEPSLCTSDTLGLLALMCFHAARIDSRLDADGFVVPLDQQDRTRWDRELIGRGYTCLVRASQMSTVAAGRYHLEAAIAARHCAAREFGETDWASICSLYDRLLELGPSPLVELNRAVALSYRDGPEAAILLVEEIRRSRRLAGSHAVAAVLANLYARTGAAEASGRYLEEALASARTRHERRLIALQVERARSSYAGGSKTG
jgi:RNA polymerase sigma-70 factor (ECF subfamily)